ncbi:MAG: hypothetical protein AAF518_11100 [Spirochaetota bacterium]
MKLNIGKVLLTLGALEFLNPMLWNASYTHYELWSADLPFLAFLWLLGVYNVYLIWWKQPFRLANLLQVANLQNLAIAVIWLFLVLQFAGLVKVLLRVHIWELGLFSILGIGNFRLCKSLSAEKTPDSCNSLYL